MLRRQKHVLSQSTTPFACTLGLRALSIICGMSRFCCKTRSTGTWRDLKFAFYGKSKNVRIPLGKSKLGNDSEGGNSALGKRGFSRDQFFERPQKNHCI